MEVEFVDEMNKTNHLDQLQPWGREPFVNWQYFPT